MNRRGSTLIELLVVLAIMALLVVVAVPIANSRSSEPDMASATALREAAILRGRTQLSRDSGRVRIAAFPDGLVLSDSQASISPFTGHPSNNVSPTSR